MAAASQISSLGEQPSEQFSFPPADEETRRAQGALNAALESTESLALRERLAVARGACASSLFSADSIFTRALSMRQDDTVPTHPACDRLFDDLLTDFIAPEPQLAWGQSAARNFFYDLGDEEYSKLAATTTFTSLVDGATDAFDESVDTWLQQTEEVKKKLKPNVIAPLMELDLTKGAEWLQRRSAELNPDLPANQDSWMVPPVLEPLLAAMVDSVIAALLAEPRGADIVETLRVLREPVSWSARVEMCNRIHASGEKFPTNCGDARLKDLGLKARLNDWFGKVFWNELKTFLEQCVLSRRKDVPTLTIKLGAGMSSTVLSSNGLEVVTEKGGKPTSPFIVLNLTDNARGCATDLKYSPVLHLTGALLSRRLNLPCRVMERSPTHALDVAMHNRLMRHVFHAAVINHRAHDGICHGWRGFYEKFPNDRPVLEAWLRDHPADPRHARRAALFEAHDLTALSQKMKLREEAVTADELELLEWMLSLRQTLCVESVIAGAIDSPFIVSVAFVEKKDDLATINGGETYRVGRCKRWIARPCTRCQAFAAAHLFWARWRNPEAACWE